MPIESGLHRNNMRAGRSEVGEMPDPVAASGEVVVDISPPASMARLEGARGQIGQLFPIPYIWNATSPVSFQPLGRCQRFRVGDEVFAVCTSPGRATREDRDQGRHRREEA